MKMLIAAFVFGGQAGIAAAQVLGTVTITAEGGSALTVAPGTPVSIGVRVAYDPMAIQLAGLQGAVRVDGDAGSASNFVFNLGAGPLINTGSFQGGSRVGMDVASGPILFFGINPLWAANPVDMLTYDLTLDEPGEYTVGWEFPATAQGIRLYYATSSQPPKGFAVTETATITVVPGPGALVLMGAGSLVRRRRRG